MRLSHIIEAVHCKPWLIVPSHHAAIVSLLESKLADVALTIEGGNHDQIQGAQRQGESITGRPMALPGMEIIDGIAHIPIDGVIGQRVSGLEKSCGAVDVKDIANELSQADSDQSVRGIILDINSPGGMVSGTPELAATIRRVQKPVYAFTESLAASAAYWIASAADAVFATESADLGSIGVYMPWVDSTARASMQGLKVDLIKAGKLKGAGYPGTSLSEDQRAHLQSRVNEIHAMFKASVRQGRGSSIKDESMEGQTFMAREAINRGLVDQIVDSKADVVAMF